MSKDKIIEWSAALSGLLGAILLALNSEVSGYGFIAFLVSNVMWLAFSMNKKAWGLFTMQIGFTVTSLIGIANWL